MAKVIGIKPTIYNFTDKSGREVHSEGYTIYSTFEQKDCEGLACDRVYLSSSKLDFLPRIGDEIEILYNRFGKPSGIRIG